MGGSQVRGPNDVLVCNFMNARAVKKIYGEVRALLCCVLLLVSHVCVWWMKPAT